MQTFTFQATLIALIPVKAETRADAERKLREALVSSCANFGMLGDQPIVVAVEIEGNLDLFNVAD